MADFGPQVGNAFPAVNAPIGGTKYLVPQRPLPFPSPQRRPIRGQRRGHAGAQQNTVSPPVNADGNDRRPDGQWEDVPPPIENIAAQSRPQDPRYTGVAYDAMAHYHPPQPVDPAVLYEYRDGGIDNYARAVPAQGQAIGPPALDMGIFDYPALHAAPGPVRAFLDEWPYQGPIPNEPATEALRQRANHYLQQANSQVVMVGVERGGASGFKVVITLESAVLL